MKILRNFKSIKILSISFILLASCNSKQDNNETNIAKETIYPVKVKEVKVHEIAQTINYTGTIIAFKENHLGASSPSKIEKIMVEVGDRVKKGDLLVQMDKTNLNQAKIQYETLKIDLQRMDTLMNIGSVSKQKYDQIKTQYDIAKTNLQFMQENTQLRAPITGVITGKYQNDGEIFSMSPVPNVGKAAIVSIMQLNPVKVIINISGKYFPLIKKGQKADIILDIYPKDNFGGTVYKVYPTIDPSTQTFPVEITISNNNEKLRPGMYVKVKLTFGQIKTILVPSISVLKQTGTNERYVFTYETGKAIRKTVYVGRIFNDLVEITNGLSINDKIITSGQDKLLDQSTVKIVK
jgi:RND family efflux transporter MFP subunit